MSKGIASRNSLKALAHPLQQFIVGWGAGVRPAAASDATAMPAPYALAALRGEGVLRQRFFGPLMQKLPVTLHAEQQIALWQELVEDGGHVTAWVQRLGIAKALRREAALPAHAAQESRTLYCLLLDTLAQQAPELLPWAVEGHFWHLWRSKFPDSAPKPQHDSATHAMVLRERLVRTLRKHHREATEVKESFKQLDEAVEFALLGKQASVGQWVELVRLERPRLKTARLAAYEAALQLHA